MTTAELCAYNLNTANGLASHFATSRNRTGEIMLTAKQAAWLTRVAYACDQYHFGKAEGHYITPAGDPEGQWYFMTIRGGAGVLHILTNREIRENADRVRAGHRPWGV